MGRLVIVACTNVGRYIIEEIMRNPNIKTEIAGVVDLNAQRAVSKANYDSYSDLAVKYGLPVFYCDNVNDRDCLDFIADKKPDLILQTGWSQKFRDELLSIPKYGCIGEHPAPLPKGRGAACINWAILTGEREWGDTFFQMVKEYDKGVIYAQSFFRIEEYDDVFTVYEKVAACAARTVRENMDKWTAGEFCPIAQDDSLATYYKKRTPADGQIRDFGKPAKELHDFIRAQARPYPCAFFMRNGEKVMILSSAVRKGEYTDAEAGTVVSAGEGCISVACRGGEILELRRLQLEGRPSQWADSFLEEAGGAVGSSLIL